MAPNPRTLKIPGSFLHADNGCPSPVPVAVYNHTINNVNYGCYFRFSARTIRRNLITPAHNTCLMGQSPHKNCFYFLFADRPEYLDQLHTMNTTIGDPIQWLAQLSCINDGNGKRIYVPKQVLAMADCSFPPQTYSLPLWAAIISATQSGSGQSENIIIAKLQMIPTRKTKTSTKK